MIRLRRQFLIFQNRIVKVLKRIIFKQTDILTGEELVEYNNISNETKAIFIKCKNLRKLNNIYYIWDYNENFKKLIYKYKFNRKINLSADIAELVKEEIKFIIKKEQIDLVVTVPVNK
ncbi:MAG: ComF family protein, partial [Leptotrichiaceae bacterium]